MTGRTASLRNLLAIVGLIAVCLGILQAAEEGDSLAVQRAKYGDAVKAAREKLHARYRELAVQALDKKDPELAEVLQREMKVFEEQNLLVGRPEMTKAFQEYGATIKKAAADLTLQYQTAIKSELKAGRSEKSDALTQELLQLRLPTKLVSFKMLSNPLLFVQHGDHKGIVAQCRGDGNKLNATMEVVAGLAEPSYFSIRSANMPDTYMTHGGFRIVFQRYADDPVFFQNATFKKLTGLAVKNGVSFESVNYPGYYVRVRDNGELWLDELAKSQNQTLFRKQATFIQTQPQFKLFEE
jgi:hypothetical protein